MIIPTMLVMIDCLPASPKKSISPHRNQSWLSPSLPMIVKDQDGNKTILSSPKDGDNTNDANSSDNTDVSEVNSACTACRGTGLGSNYKRRRVRKKCGVCWGTGVGNQKHPKPSGGYKGYYEWGNKWGIYNLNSEKKHLMREIKKADVYAATCGSIPGCKGTETKDDTCSGCGKPWCGTYPVNGPCETTNGNDKKCIRIRYLVTNTAGQQVYVVKTIGGTGNGPWYARAGGKEGDVRERHNKNTVGEFPYADSEGSFWYSVYWRCQKSNHDLCTNHDKPETEFEMETPTPVYGPE